ncbi:ferredoxin [Streptomyces sp. AGS-58]|uniref:ferredoxin n=1 Tax=unclassified Streptomyces TaxID=2593676 RepID=UPI0035A3CC10
MSVPRESEERGGPRLLSIDATVCTGAGTCEAMHPELFRVGAEGHAVVSRTELTDPRDIGAATAVLDVCPTEAVRLTPADTSEEQGVRAP